MYNFLGKLPTLLLVLHSLQAGPIRPSDVTNVDQPDIRAVLSSNDNLYFEFPENEEMFFTCAPKGIRAEKLELYFDSKVIAKGIGIQIVNSTRTASWDLDGKEVKCRVYINETSFVEWTRNINVLYKPRASPVEVGLKDGFFEVTKKNIHDQNDTLKIKIQSSSMPGMIQWKVNGLNADFENYIPTEVKTSNADTWIIGLYIKKFNEKDLSKNISLAIANSFGETFINFKILHEDIKDSSDDSVSLFAILMISILILLMIILLVFLTKWVRSRYLKRRTTRGTPEVGTKGEPLLGGEDQQRQQRRGENIQLKLQPRQNLFLKDKSLHMSFGGQDFYESQQIFNSSRSACKYDDAHHFAEEISKQVNLGKDVQLLITADPGMGKTKALEEIGKHLSRFDTEICILHIAMRSFAKYARETNIDNQTSVVDYISSEFACDKFQIDYIQEKILQNKVLLLVDELYEPMAHLKVEENFFNGVLSGNNFSFIAAARTCLESVLANQWQIKSGNIFHLSALEEQTQFEFFRKCIPQIPPANHKRDAGENKLSVLNRLKNEKIINGEPLLLVLAAEILRTENEQKDEQLWSHKDLLRSFIEASIKDNVSKACASPDDRTFRKLKARDMLYKISLSLFEESDYQIKENDKQHLVKPIIILKDKRPVFTHLIFAEYLLADATLKRLMTQDIDHIEIPERVLDYVFTLERLNSVRQQMVRFLSERSIADINHLVDQLLKRGNLSGVQFIITSCKVKPDTNVLDNALCEAVTQKHAEIALLLIENGANACVETEGGENCLHMAAEMGHLDLIKMLLLKKEDLNKNSRSGTPLIRAAKAGNIQSMKILLEQSKKSTLSMVDDEGNTCIHVAAHTGNCGFIKALFEHPVSNKAVNNIKNQTNKAKKTALLLAMEEEHLEVVKYLLENEAVFKNLDGNKSSCLHIAVQLEKCKLLETLLKREEQRKIIDEKNSEGKNPVLLALERNQADVVHLLLKHGADPTIQDKQGNSCLHVAAQSGNITFLNQVLNSPMLKNDVTFRILNKKNNADQTPLLLAMENRHFEVALELLKHGADPSKQDKRWNSCLHMAAQNGNGDFISCALQKIPTEDRNKRLNCGNKLKKTPLLLAVENKNYEIARTLLEYGANPSIQDDKGNSCVHLAAQNDNIEFLKMIFKVNKDVVKILNILNGDKESPLLLAIKNKNFEVAFLLLSCKAEPCNECYTLAMRQGNISLVTGLLTRKSIDENHRKSLIKLAQENNLTSIADFLSRVGSPA